ncbi:hypothetical protein [Massilia sp. CFBP 13647]|uniref:hypothetical protein n=1 Tax=unclassified Massilia TaxID=2609279 RepID=UPI0035A5F554
MRDAEHALGLPVHIDEIPVPVHRKETIGDTFQNSDSLIRKLLYRPIAVGHEILYRQIR